MSGELERRPNGIPIPKGSGRVLSRVRFGVEVEQVRIRAKTKVAEFAMWEVTDLKNMQRQLEQQQPDAAEALALIANTAINSMARSVAQFCNDWE